MAQSSKEPHLSSEDLVPIQNFMRRFSHVEAGQEESSRKSWDEGEAALVAVAAAKQPTKIQRRNGRPLIGELVQERVYIRAGNTKAWAWKIAFHAEMGNLPPESNHDNCGVHVGDCGRQDALLQCVSRLSLPLY